MARNSFQFPCLNLSGPGIIRDFYRHEPLYGELLNLFCVSFFFAQTPPLEIVAQQGPRCHSFAGEGGVSFVLRSNKRVIGPLREVKCACTISWLHNGVVDLVSGKNNNNKKQNTSSPAELVLHTHTERGTVFVCHIV